MAEVTHLLFESATGYGLFQKQQGNDIAALEEDMQNSVVDFSRFQRMVVLKGFIPFKSAEMALENINDISDGFLPDYLKDFLELNLPKAKEGKKSKFALGVQEPQIGKAIQEELKFSCQSNEPVTELLRGIRMHASKYLGVKDDLLEKAQLGLGHSYSRSKVKFDINRADKHIIQSIALLDSLDKDVNTFAMRVREWYGWHFPELVKLVNDNYMYAKCAVLIKRKEDLSEDSLKGLEEIVMDEDKAAAILVAAKSSMGFTISDIDLLNIDVFAQKVIKLAEYRKHLQDYLHSKMSQVAPNLAALIGDPVGARLIAHAGGLTNLAKYPASTVQILGAEKALFRALKTKGNTPKYGLIYHSSFIGRAGTKNKGRISRYLANKCSIASRIDCFSDVMTDKFGEMLKDQVEERLKFYDSGDTPRKNLDVMRDVMKALEAEAEEAQDGDNKDKKKKKKKDKDKEEEEPKKKKKKKADEEPEEEAPKKKKKKTEDPEEEAPKKKKKKKDKE